MNFLNFLSPMLTRGSSSCVMPHQHLQQRFMSKYLSKAAAKRLPLSTKRARKGYYKGKGGTKEGKLNSKGKFIVDQEKRLELIVPDLEGFKVSNCRDRQCYGTSLRVRLIMTPFPQWNVSAQTVHRIDSIKISPRDPTTTRSD
eukprot:scaffold3827_cov179-Cylindrotheca_fusiformis.AAC.49